MPVIKIIGSVKNIGTAKEKELMHTGYDFGAVILAN